MRFYKLYDIAWDFENDTDKPDDLPETVIMQSALDVDVLRDGVAADWLSDRYGFCVKSMKIEAIDESAIVHSPIFVDVDSVERRINAEHEDDPDSYNAGWNDGYREAVKELLGARYSYERRAYYIPRCDVAWCDRCGMDIESDSRGNCIVCGSHIRDIGACEK